MKAFFNFLNSISHKLGIQRFLFRHNIGIFLYLKSLFSYFRDEELRHLVGLMKKSNDFVFIDIGAYQGVYTWWASRCENVRTCVMIEANPYNFRLLSEQYGALEKLDIIHAACNASGNECHFNLPKVKSRFSENEYVNGLGSVRDEFCTSDAVTDIESHVVPGVTIGELIERYRPEVASFVVKIDIEGGELEVVEALSNELLGGCSLILFVEVSTMTYSKVVAHLTSQNFSLAHEGPVEGNNLNLIFSYNPQL